MTINLVALYKKPENTREFDHRCFDSELPLAGKMPGLKRVELSRVVGTASDESEFYLMADLHFDDMDALKAAVSSSEGRPACKDVMSLAKDIISMHLAQVEEKVPAHAG